MDSIDVLRILEDLEIDGYAVVEGLLSSDHISNLLLEIETIRELALSAGRPTPWRTSLHSCVFETIPLPVCDDETSQIRCSSDLYKHHRTQWPLKKQAYNLLFSSQLTDLVCALLGPNAVLMNDQYIVKPPKTDMGLSLQTTPTSVHIPLNQSTINNPTTAFAWHRDSDWCRDDTAHSPYISIWIALDDASIENGCLHIKPGSHKAPSKEINGHHAVRAVPVKAGTAIIMSDLVEHCSGENCTTLSRRAWMPQFSSSPIVWNNIQNPKHGLPVSFAIALQRK